MRVDDFILLGTTVPEPSRTDNRVFVCSAGYSPELRRMLRIYPLSRKNPPKRWNKYSIELEVNKKDQRFESYKIAGDRGEVVHEDINSRFQLVGRATKDDEQYLADKFTINSIKQANEERLSLGIIYPKYSPVLVFDENQEAEDHPQARLFDDRLPQDGARRFPFAPKLRFDIDDGAHCLSVRDWGCYEYMRKNPYSHEKLALNLDKNPPLLIGNMNSRRNSWLIISVLPVRLKKELDLFSDAI